MKRYSAETIEIGRQKQDYYGGSGFMPRTEEELKELDESQKAVWG